MSTNSLGRSTDSRLSYPMLSNNPRQWPLPPLTLVMWNIHRSGDHRHRPLTSNSNKAALELRRRIGFTDTHVKPS